MLGDASVVASRRQARRFRPGLDYTLATPGAPWKFKRGPKYGAGGGDSGGRRRCAAAAAAAAAVANVAAAAAAVNLAFCVLALTLIVECVCASCRQWKLCCCCCGFRQRLYLLTLQHFDVSIT